VGSGVVTAPAPRGRTDPRAKPDSRANTARSGARAIVGVTAVVALVAYPFVLRALLERGGVRPAAAALLVVLALSFAARRFVAREPLRPLLFQYAAAGTATAFALGQGTATALLLIPALPSLALLGVFAATLRHGPPMIERFARRISGPGFREEMVGHCRQATVAWCVFFGGNALVIGALAFAAPLDWWALYTGVLTYLAMGATFGAEFAVRRLRKARLAPRPTSR